jgi:2'-5' RNA ligase
MPIDLDTAQFKNTACIVYPVEYPDDCVEPNLDDLHSTIIFLGDVDEDLGGRDIDYLLHHLSYIDNNYYQYVNTLDWALYGPDKNIPVVKLELSDTMEQIHHQIEVTLASVGIVSPSEFDYSPHVTVTTHAYENKQFPDWVLLKPAELWYQGEKAQFGITSPVSLEL